MKDEKTPECKLKDRKGGDFYCETCGNMGKQRYLLAECPHQHLDSWDIAEIMGGL